MQESQEKLTSDPISVFCDIEEDLLSYVLTSVSSDICYMTEVLGRECRVISVIINSQRHRESSVSEPLLRFTRLVYTLYIGVILASLIIGRIPLSC